MSGETIFSTTGKPISVAMRAASLALVATSSRVTCRPAAQSNRFAASSEKHSPAEIGALAGNARSDCRLASKLFVKPAIVIAACTARVGSSKTA